MSLLLRASLAALAVLAVCVGSAPPPTSDLTRRAELAAERVSAILGVPVHPVVVVPSSDGEAARLAGVGSVDGLAALADRGRVIVVPGNFAKLTPTGRDVVLTHELTHVAAGTGGVPAWLREGFADYVAYRDAGLPVKVAAAELAGDVRAGRLPYELPGPQDFAPGAVRLAQAYQEAWLACRFVAERFGEDRLVRLYRDPTSLGITRGWREYVLEQLG
ncbi:hypothetical protein ACIBG8_17800 [Nonomuraea sp. NPDC050556]|uniref:hypothetical protein n=1 Tax=Nonomuraea sp. NPDC050556 TaxID=3364369 RepID=UPI00379F5ECE